MPLGKNLFVVTIAFLALVLPGRTVMADGMQGSVELTRSNTDFKATDATGLTTESRTSAVFQRYRLSFDDMLYPLVNLQAGVRFDKTTTETAGTKATFTNLVPSAALVLRNPFVNAGVGYEMLEQKNETRGFAPITNYRETESAYLGFKPEGLPPLNMQFLRQHTYDADHVSIDVLMR
ncbi:MAG TPA: hypothetical protein VLN91_05310, partial [Nitrospirota bacterium]|nr:hypothetical protein [Nitrospirota bacterium]